MSNIAKESPAAFGARRASEFDHAAELIDFEVSRHLPDLQVPSRISTSTFDYAELAPKVATSLREQAGIIRGRITKTTEIIIQTGRDLADAKQHLDHDQFTTWVAAEIGINIRTAQRYIAAANWAEDKYDTVSCFSPSAVYRLSAKSTPPEISTAVIAKAKAGETMSDDIIIDMVKDARRQRRQVRKERQIADRRSKRTHDRREAERRKYDEERRLAEHETRSMAQEIIRRIGPENALFIADAFRDHFLTLDEALRREMAA